jgi:hypothetical protein
MVYVVSTVLIILEYSGPAIYSQTGTRVNSILGYGLRLISPVGRVHGHS